MRFKKILPLVFVVAGFFLVGMAYIDSGPAQIYRPTILSSFEYCLTGFIRNSEFLGFVVEHPRNCRIRKTS